MKTAATIILYNPNIEVLERIRQYLHFVKKIYIIDNSDSVFLDFSGIKTDKIEYIRNNNNYGIAFALNQGADMAVKDKFDWLVTLDQDSLFNEEILKYLTVFIKSHKEINAGIVSPFHEILFGKDYTKLLDYSEEEEVMTSGNLLNLKAFKQAGPFMSELFIDSVDHEYCLRLQTFGYKIIKVNKIPLKHNLGNRTVHFWMNPFNIFSKKRTVFKTVAANNHNHIRKYYMVRNRLYVSSLYKEAFPSYREKMIKSLLEEVRNVIMYEDHKILKLKSMLAGYLDYRKGRLGKKEF